MNDSDRKKALLAMASYAKYESCLHRLVGIMLASCDGNLVCTINKLTRSTKCYGKVLGVFEDNQIVEALDSVLTQWRGAGLIRDSVSPLRVVIEARELSKMVSPELTVPMLSPNFANTLDEKTYNHLVSVTRDDPFAWAAAVTIWALPEGKRNEGVYQEIAGERDPHSIGLLALLQHGAYHFEGDDFSTSHEKIDAALTAVDRMVSDL